MFVNIKCSYLTKILVLLVIILGFSLHETLGQFVGHEDTHGYEDSNQINEKISPFKLILILELIIFNYIQYLNSFSFFKSDSGIKWYLKILTLLTIPLFLVSDFNMEYNFYVFFRYYICLTCMLYIFYKYLINNTFSKWHFVITILYNPIFPLEFNKPIWSFLNFLVNLLFVANLILFDSDEDITKKPKVDV